MQVQKIKGKQGKKRWNKIQYTTQILSAVAEQRDRESNRKIIKAKLNVDDLFVIDTKPCKRIKKALEKDRFKRKITIKKNFYEQKKIRKLKKNMKNKNYRMEKQPKEQTDEIYDLWADDNQDQNKKQRKKRKRKRSNPHLFIKALQLPHPGQSYNPQYSDYQDLLDKVITEEIQKDFKDTRSEERYQKKLLLKLKKQKAKYYRGHTKKERATNDLGRKRKAERQLKHSYNLIKKYLKEITKKQKKIKEKIEEKKQNQQNQKLLKQKQGVVERGQRIGRYQYHAIDIDFVIEDELKERISHVEANSNLIRETWDNLLRRGMIDPVNPGKSVKARRIPVYKLHRAHNQEIEEVDQEIKQIK